LTVAALATGTFWLAGNLGGVNSDVDIESIAVLPPTWLGPLAADEALAAVVHEGLIAALYGVEGLRATPRPSVLVVAEPGLGTREIGRRLSVDAVLEGGIERAGDSIRIRLRLIESEEEREIWTEQYASPMTGVLNLPGLAVLDLADELGVSLDNEFRDRLSADVEVEEEALEALKLGDAHFRRFVEEEPLRNAIAEYERATLLDPTFSLAFAKLSYAHTWMWWWRFDRSAGRLVSALSAAEAALGLDPRLAYAHLARGFHEEAQHRFREALPYLLEARDLQEGNPDHWLLLGLTYRGYGARDEAVRHLARAAELDPSNTVYLNEVAGTLLDQGRPDEAAGFVARSLAIDPDGVYAAAYRAEIMILEDESYDRALDALRPFAAQMGPGLAWRANFLPHALSVADAGFRAAVVDSNARPGALESRTARALFLGDVYRMIGKADSARFYFETARTHADSVLQGRLDEPELSVYAATLHHQLGLALAGLGEHELAIEEGLAAVEALPVDADESFGPDQVVALARIYTMVGEPDLAIDALEALLDVGLTINRTDLRIHPWWDPLRGHPRFDGLLASG
jgi:tetratricopeptide (TPR) repeat protein